MQLSTPPLPDSPLRLFRRVPGWSEAATSDLLPLSMGAVRRQVAEGQSVSRPRELQIVVRGSVLTRGGLVLAGDTLGFAEALGGLPPAPAEAVTPVEVLGLSAQHLEDALEESFTLWKLTMRHLARAVLARGVAPTPTVPAMPVDRPLRLSERITLLRGLPPVVTGIEALAELALAADEVTFAPGQRLWEPAARMPRVYLVAAGTVRRDDGRIFTAGHRPGLLESLAAVPITSGATAETAVRALALDLETIDDVMEDHPDAGRDVLALMARASVALPS